MMGGTHLDIFRPDRHLRWLISRLLTGTSYEPCCKNSRTSLYLSCVGTEEFNKLQLQLRHSLSEVSPAFFSSSSFISSHVRSLSFSRLLSSLSLPTTPSPPLLFSLLLTSPLSCPTSRGVGREASQSHLVCSPLRLRGADETQCFVCVRVHFASRQSANIWPRAALNYSRRAAECAICKSFCLSCFLLDVRCCTTL